MCACSLHVVIGGGVHLGEDQCVQDVRVKHPSLLAIYFVENVLDGCIDSEFCPASVCVCVVE